MRQRDLQTPKQTTHIPVLGIIFRTTISKEFHCRGFLFLNTFFKHVEDGFCHSVYSFLLLEGGLGGGVITVLNTSRLSSSAFFFTSASNLTCSCLASTTVFTFSSSTRWAPTAASTRSFWAFRCKSACCSCVSAASFCALRCTSACLVCAS